MTRHPGVAGRRGELRLPLSTREKIRMGLQATAALVTSILVIARGVGGLDSG